MNRCNANLNVLLPAVISLALLTSGCTTPPHVEPYRVQTFEQYKNVQIQDGVAVAVYPMNNSQEVEKHFGNDILSEGVLPVYVLVENRHATSSFVVSGDKVNLQPPAISFDRTVIKKDSFGNALFYVSIPLILGIGLPMFLNAYGRDDGREDLRYNFEISELARHTLSPGKRVGGFVYFGVPIDPSSAHSRVLTLEIYSLNDGTTKQFKIPIEARKL